MMKQFLVLLVVCFVGGISAQCPSVTTASGTRAPTGVICSGDLIFEDNFDTFNLENWEHEVTMAGGGNWEFQWYTNNRSNSWTEGGILYLKPTYTSDVVDVTATTVNIHGGRLGYDYCTDQSFWGCERGGSPDSVLNPIRSARLRTMTSFAFKYGRAEIRAQIPAGDWLWPAIWMMPKHNTYGTWPVSGEIDIMESRGNRNLMENGQNIGTERIGSTLHYGPYVEQNGYPFATDSVNSAPGNGFDRDFHNYQVEWTPTYFSFSVDNVEHARFTLDNGFWERGQFAQNVPGVENPWVTGGPMAPFDHEFFLILNVAVGGIAFFPDGLENPGGKPWSNSGGHASTDFWNGRGQWEPTWNGRDTAMKVDYVRVWAI